MVPLGVQNLTQPDATDAAQAAGVWANVALAEHASIASFARFALQLLSLGAPPALLQGAISAMADELKHTQLAFGLAQELSGRTFGPTGLDVSDILQGATAPEGILAAAIHEGCVEETVSAHLLSAALERAELASVRSVLRELEQDEARHAELAWQFVAWLLECQPELHARAVECFAQALVPEPIHDTANAASAGSLERFGCASRGTRAAVRARTLRDVIAPRASLLLSAALSR